MHFLSGVLNLKLNSQNGCKIFHISSITSTGEIFIVFAQIRCYQLESKFCFNEIIVFFVLPIWRQLSGNAR